MMTEETQPEPPDSGSPAGSSGVPRSKDVGLRLGANAGGPPKGRMVKGGVQSPSANTQGGFWAAIKSGWEASEPATERPGHKPPPVTSVPNTPSIRDAWAGIGAFQGVGLEQTEITFKFKRYPVAGAKATVEIGAVSGRSTATRVVLGSVVSLGVGTMIGFMAKKKTQNVYLSVELADGQVIIVEAKPSQETKARKFAAKINQAARAK